MSASQRVLRNIECLRDAFASLELSSIASNTSRGITGRACDESLPSILDVHQSEYAIWFVSEAERRAQEKRHIVVDACAAVLPPDREEYSFAKTEEEAWVRYLQEYEEAFQSREALILKPGEVQGPSYEAYLMFQLRSKGISQKVYDDHLGGILERYTQRWIRYLTVLECRQDGVQLSASESALNTSNIQARVFNRLDLMLVHDFPAVNLRCLSIQGAVEKHFESIRATFNNFRISSVVDDQVQFEHRVNQEVTELIQLANEVFESYIEVYHQDWVDFHILSEELQELRLMLLSLKRRESLDEFSDRLGDGFVRFSDFQAEMIRTREDTDFLVRERKWVESAISRLTTSPEEGALLKALQSWSIALNEVGFSERYFTCPDLAHCSSIVDLEAVIAAKKGLLERARSDLPASLLNHQENFYRLMRRATMGLSESIGRVSERPLWFRNNEDKALQVANAIQSRCHQETERSEEILESSFLLWFEELKSAHGRCEEISEPLLSLNETIMGLFQSENLKNTVSNTVTLLASCGSVDERVKVARAQLRNISEYYYGFWIGHKLSFEVQASLKNGIDDAFAFLPGDDKKKLHFILQAKAMVFDRGRICEYVRRYILNIACS